MKTPTKSEKGQAIVMIAFAIVALFALVALAMDGGHAFSDRRQAQNAADAAALAATLRYLNKEGDYVDWAYAKAEQNGYPNNGVRSTVTISGKKIYTPPCTGTGNTGMEFTVTIDSYINTWFAQIIGIRQLHNQVSSTGRGCFTYERPFVLGNAIVSASNSTDSSDCAFDSDTGAAKWIIHGGGIYSNGCAVAKNNVAFDKNADGTYKYCAAAPNTDNVSGFPCEQAGPSLKFPDDFEALMPPNPCLSGQAQGTVTNYSYLEKDGTTKKVAIHQNPPAPNHNTAVTYSSAADKASDSDVVGSVYCISNFDPYKDVDLTLHDVTLYVTDTDFDVKFAGSYGSFAGYGTAVGPWAGFYMVVAMNGHPCPEYNSNDHPVQTFELRGNGKENLLGSFLAPTACIDYRGNSNGFSVESQLIGYEVSANGTSDVEITYNKDTTAQQVVPPQVELIK